MQLSPRECVVDGSTEASRLRHTLQRSGVLITERRKGEPDPPYPFLVSCLLPLVPLQWTSLLRMWYRTLTGCSSLRPEQPALPYVSWRPSVEGREGHVLSVLVAQLDLTHAMASLAALIKYLEVCPCA